MRALTLTQPWAQLVALKAKRYETRSWTTNYRGPLAIHASLEFPKAARALCRCEPFASALLGAEELPLGCVVAICDLAAVVPTSSDEDSLFGEANDFPDEELPFGDFSPGRYAWLLTNIRALESPIPARGARSLWDWDNTALFDLSQAANTNRIMKKISKLTQLQFRQGDVLIERVPSLKTSGLKPKESGRVILAHGEVTGHAHEIAAPKHATMHEVNAALRQLGDLTDTGPITQDGLIIERGTSVVHQEHASIPLDEGKYIVRRQREYRPDAIRNVAD